MPSAACSDVPQPVTTTGSPRIAVVRSRRARPSTADDCSSRATSRSASAGSAAIDSVIRYGGPSRSAGISVLAHGSGGPGSSRSGSNDGSSAIRASMAAERIRRRR